MSSSQYVFLDLPTRPPRTAWSFNPWRTRLCLNYKGVDYKTEWIEYPDIRPRLEGLVAPNDTSTPGDFPYSIPTILCPDGTYVMDSRKIADALEKAHPQPSLHLDSPYLAKIEALFHGFLVASFPLFANNNPKRLFNAPSIDYWMKTRTLFVGGMPLDQYEAEAGGEKCRSQMEPILKEVSAMLKENSEGPFFMGNTVGYADFIWVALLKFYRTIGEDILQEVLTAAGDDGHLHFKILEAAGPWLERNDH